MSACTPNGQDLTAFGCALQTSRVSTFGSTTKRFDSSPSLSVEHGPETQESQLERDMKPGVDSKQHSPVSRSRRGGKPSSVFASASTRFQLASKMAGPSPGDYEVCVWYD